MHEHDHRYFQTDEEIYRFFFYWFYSFGDNGNLFLNHDNPPFPPLLGCWEATGRVWRYNDHWGQKGVRIWNGEVQFSKKNNILLLLIKIRDYSTGVKSFKV